MMHLMTQNQLRSHLIGWKSSDSNKLINSCISRNKVLSSFLKHKGTTGTLYSRSTSVSKKTKQNKAKNKQTYFPPLQESPYWPQAMKSWQKNAVFHGCRINFLCFVMITRSWRKTKRMSVSLLSVLWSLFTDGFSLHHMMLCSSEGNSWIWWSLLSSDWLGS